MGSRVWGCALPEITLADSHLPLVQVGVLSPMGPSAALGPLHPPPLLLEGFPSWPLRASGQKLPVGWPWAPCSAWLSACLLSPQHRHSSEGLSPLRLECPGAGGCLARPFLPSVLGYLALSTPQACGQQEQSRALLL